jgi:hypothetical protein
VDDTQVFSQAGAVSVAWGTGDNNAKATRALSIGVSVAINEVGAGGADPVRAFIDDSTVIADADISASAKTEGKFHALAVGGSVSVASGGNSSSSSLSGAAAGAFASNLVHTSIAAGIGAGSEVKSDHGSITLAADDLTTLLRADSFGMSVAYAASTKQNSSTAALAIGVGIAMNDVDGSISATIDDSTVDALGDITLHADAATNISALGVGVAASAARGTGSTGALAGAGSAAVNRVDNRIRSAITDSGANQHVRSSAGSVILSASDDADIVGVAGTVALAVGLNSGSSGPTVAVAVGVSVVINEVGLRAGQSTQALIDNSSVSADDDLSLDAVSGATIYALAAGGSGAAAGSNGSTGVTGAFAGAGVGTANTVKQTIAATVADSALVATHGQARLHATDSAQITADAGAVAVAIALSASGTALSGSVGVAVALNTIEDQVWATLDDSTLTALSVDVKAESKRDASLPAGDQIAALALTISAAGAGSASSTAGALAGAGVAAVNRIDNDIHAGIGSSTVNVTGAGGVALTAQDNATIRSEAIAGAIALSGSTGGNAGAVAVGISVALNHVNNDVLADIDDSTVTAAAGSVALSASEDAEIHSITVAASVAIAASASNSALAIAGGGAASVNSILSTANAVIADSTVQAGGAVTLVADSDSIIDATVATAAIGVGAGSSNGLAAAIGVAVAQNFIGYDEHGNLVDGQPSQIRATIDNSSVIAGGALSATATANQDIDALVLAASVAVGVGGSNGFALAGSGVFTENKIATDIKASISNDAAAGIHASGVTLGASDSSDIDAFAGAASVAVAAGGSNAVAVSIGVALAQNRIDNDVEASIINVDDLVAGSGGIGLHATSAATIDAVAAAASLAVGLGSTAGIAVSGAGAESTNIILTKANAFVQDSQLTSGGGVSLSADMAGSINAKVIAASVAVAAGSTAGIGASIGVAVARNFIGWDPTGTAVAANHSSSTPVATLATNDTVVVSSGPMAGDVYRYLGATLTDGDPNQDGVQLVDLSVQNFGDASLWRHVSLAESAAEAQAYLSDSGVGANGAVTLDARNNAAIDAIVVAASAALALGGTAGVAVSGAGVYTENKIRTCVKGFIEGDGRNTATDGISARSVDISATDSSGINAIAGAASVAASLGGTAGVSVSIGLSLAFNEVNNEVEAYIVDADQGVTTSTGSIEIHALTQGKNHGAFTPTGLVTANNLGDAAKADDSDPSTLATRTADVKNDSQILAALRAQVNAQLALEGMAPLAQAGSVAPAAMLTQDSGVIGLAAIEGGAANRIRVNSPHGYVNGDAVAFNGASAGGLVSGTTYYVVKVIDDPLTANLDESRLFIQLAANKADAIADTPVVLSLTASATAGQTLRKLWDLREGTTVQSAGVVHRFVGVDRDDVNLGVENYAGADWFVPETLKVSTLVEGQSWSLVAPDGKTFVLEWNSVTGKIGVSQSTINAVSAAASLAAGFGGTAGIAVSGAGAVAQNVVLGKTSAHVQNSALRSADAVDLSATSDASIASTVVAASVAIGIGGTAGIGVSIGVAVARNFIGWEPGNEVATPLEVKSQLIDTSVNAAGAVDLVSQANQRINSIVFAGSAAVAVGGTVGVAASGAGVFSENRVGVDVAALIDGKGDGTTTIDASRVTLSADDSSTIHAFAGAASVAAAFGTVGVAVSIGVALARNTIDSEVLSAIEQADVEAHAGAISITAGDDATIDAVAFAASVAVGIGGSVGIAVSGAGAWAENIIIGGVDAHAAQSALEATGAVTVAAENLSVIDAKIIAASAAVGVGVDAGAGASIGVALARNLVGSSRDEDQAYLHLSTDNVLTLNHGDTVRVARGVREGDVYEYLGPTTTVAYDYSSAGSAAKIETGDRVKVGSGSAATVYEYIAEDELLAPTLSNTAQYGNEKQWRKVTAIPQDFADPDTWKIVSLDDSPLAVTAYIADTPVHAGAALSVSATGDQSIDAFVFAGSVAVAGGLYLGLAFSGAGAAADNRITTDVSAFIDGNDGSDSIINATSVGLLAQDISTINADTAAASLAAAFGIAGIALSIGVSVASNAIDSSVEAFIADADVTASTGSITVTATEDASIDALSVAASLAVSGGIVAISISGAGAVALNSILGGAEAYVVDSTLTAANATNGAITFEASNTSDISATIAAASAAIAGGGGGLGISIGVAVARNTIGQGDAVDVHAYAQDTDITAGTDLRFRAEADQTVDALVLAMSAALAAGAGAGIAASGSGVYTENRIAVDVKSAIDGDGSTTVTADHVTVEASDESNITANAAAVAIAAGFGYVGAAVSIGVSLAFNSIDSDVNAFIDGADVTTSLSDVSSAQPSLRITAVTGDEIHALSTAASLAVAAGAIGIGIAGAGAWAENTILGSTLADATSSSLHSAGSVAISADNHSDIDATIVAAAAAAAGGVAGIGAAIGVALARNLIGNATDPSTHYDYRSTDNQLTLAKGQTVLIERGVRAGDIYEYLGPNLAITHDYASTDTASVTQGKRVKVGDAVYEYVNDAALPSTDLSTVDYDNGAQWRPVTALQLDYANPDLFRRVNLERDPMQVKAYAQDTGITAAGALEIAATSQMDLDAFVLAGSVAISGGAIAAGLSGAGAASENRIAADVAAFIDGVDSRSIISATGINVSADDLSTISADTAAASIAASFGLGGLSVAIGVSIATNTIDNDVLAYIADANAIARTGAITVAATEDAGIDAVSVAASLAVAAGGIGASLAGAGAVADNIILGKADAYALDSELSAATEVSFTALNTSKIDATIVGAAVSLAAGAVGGIGLSIGAAVARNFIGWDASIDHHSDETALGTLSNGDTVRVASGPRAGEVYKYIGSSTSDADPLAIGNQPINLSTQDYGDLSRWVRVDSAALEVQAYTENTGIQAGTMLSLKAESEQTIHAEVLAIAAAVATGFVGITGAGAGSTAQNFSATVVKARIDGDGDGISAGGITLTALDTSAIDADVAAAAVAFSFAPIGAAAAVAVSLADNQIRNAVEASISNADTYVRAIGDGLGNVGDIGDIRVWAKETSGIHSSSAAAALAVGSLAIAGSGATASNTIANSVDAFVLGATGVQARQAVFVDADDTATIDATIVSVAAAAGLAGVAVAVSLAESTVGDYVLASIGHSTVTAQAGSIAVTADTLQTIDATSVTAALAATLAGAGARSVVTIEGITAGSIDTATLTALGAGSKVIVTGTSTAVVEPSTTAVAAALGSVASITSSATIGGATQAYATGASTIVANGVDILATSINTATPTVTGVSVGGVTGTGARSTSLISRATEAFVGPNGRVSAGSGPIQIKADSTSTADGTTTATTVGAVAIAALVVDSTVSGHTSADIGANAIVNAGSLLLSSKSRNTATADPVAVSVSVAGGAGINAMADIAASADTDARIGADAQISLAGALNVSADAHNIATASAKGGAGGLITGVVMLSEAHVRGGTSAAMDGDVLGSSSVTVSALAVNTADARTLAISIGAGGSLTGTGTLAEVTADANVESSVGSSASITTQGNLWVSASGDNDAIAKSDSGAGGALTVSVGVLKALVGGGVKAAFDGDVADAGAIKVEATGNNNADAEALLISVGLFAGAGANAYAEVTSTADVEALVGATAQITALGATVDVLATGTNNAAAVARGGVAGLGVSVAAMLPTAKVAGGVHAAFDGDLLDLGVDAAALNVKALGENTAAATVRVASISVAAGAAGATAIAEVTNGATVAATVADTASIATSGAVVVDARLKGLKNQALANAFGLAGGGFAGVSVMMADAKVGGSVLADLDGDVLAASMVTVEANGGNRAESHTTAAGIGALGGSGTSAVAEVTADADVSALVGQTANLTTAGALLVKATGDNDAITDSNTGSGGIVGITAGLLQAKVSGAVQAELDGDVGNASSIKVEAIGDNNADAEALAIAIGLFSGAGANAYAEVTNAANVEALVGQDAAITAPGAIVDVLATGQNTATATANGGGGGLISISVMLPTAKVGGAVRAEFDGDLIDAATDAAALNVKALGENVATATALVASISLAGGAGATASAEVSSEADTDARVGEHASIAVSGAILVDARLQGEMNKAYSKAEGGAGGVLASVAVMLADSKVGGGVSADFDGDVSRATTVTVQAEGRNFADTDTRVVSIGTFGGAGSGALAEVTDQADVSATVGDTAAISMGGSLLVRAVGDNDAVVESDAGSGGVVGITGSTLSAKVGGGVKAELDGDVSNAASIKVEAIGDNNADAKALAIAIGLFAGAGANAYAEVTNAADVEALVGQDSLITAPGASVDVLATGRNTATAKANGGSGGLISVSVMLPTAKVGGGVKAEFDGDLSDAATDAASLSVKALGQNVATATTSVGGISLVGGAGAQATAEVTAEADTEAYVGESASIAVSGAIVVDARLQGEMNKARALAEGLSGGLLAAVSIMGADATVRGGVSAGFDGDVLDAGLVTVEALGGNLADADTSVLNFGLFSYAGSRTSATVDTGADVAATVAASASFAIDGALTVRATSNNRAQADSDAGTGGLISIGNSRPEAVARSATTASLNGDLTRASLITVDAIGANSAVANSSLVSAGLGAGADATPVANVTSGALTKADIGAGADIGVPGADIVVRATANNSASAFAEAVSAGLVAVGKSDPTANADGRTEAALLGNVRVVGGSGNLAGARDVSVLAQGTDTSVAQIRSIVGGGISVNLATSTADTSSATTATIGSSGSAVVASRDITVKALGTTDADSSTRSTTGGGVSIANYSATATSTPTVNTTVGASTQLQATGGLISISALHNQPQAALSNGQFDANGGVNDGANTISFALPHGLHTGDAVTYNANGLGEVGGLDSGRQYGVIIPVGSTTSMQIGAAFISSALSVDLLTDTINFGAPHHFLTGDQVLYSTPAGGVTIDGLVEGKLYRVLALDTHQAAGPLGHAAKRTGHRGQHCRQHDHSQQQLCAQRRGDLCRPGRALRLRLRDGGHHRRRQRPAGARWHARRRRRGDQQQQDLPRPAHARRRRPRRLRRRPAEQCDRRPAGRRHLPRGQRR